MAWCMVHNEIVFLNSKAGAYDSPKPSAEPLAKVAVNSDMVASTESQLSGPRHTTCDKFFHKVLIEGDEITVSTADLIWLWEQKAELAARSGEVQVVRMRHDPPAAQNAEIPG